MVQEKTKDKKEKLKYNSFQNSAYIFKELWLNDKRLLFDAFVCIICSVLSPYLLAYLPKMVIGELMAQVELKRFVFNVAEFVLFFGIISFFRGCFEGSLNARMRAVQHRYILKLFDKNISCDYQYVESADHQALFARANTSISGDAYFGFNPTLSALCKIFTTLAGFILYTSVLGQLNIIIVFLLIGSSSIYLFVLSAAQRFDRKIRVPRARAMSTG